MKKILYFICGVLIIVITFSCKTYAVRQWMQQRSDGYWIVTTIHGFGNRSTIAFECKPDSIELSKLKTIKHTP